MAMASGAASPTPAMASGAASSCGSAPTPTKRMMEFTKYAQRAPKRQTTGDKSIDSEAKAHRTNLMELITLCQEDAPVTTCALSAARDKVETQDDAKMHLNAEVFSRADSLSRLDDAYKMDMIVKHTGLGAQSVAAMYDKNPDDVDYVFQYITQIRIDMRLPKELKAKPVMTSFLDERIGKVGFAPHVIEARCISEDGSIRKALCCCYRPTYAEDTEALTELTHVSTGDVLELEHAAFIKGHFSFVNPQDDINCGLSMSKGMKPIKIFDLWTNHETGPNKYEQFSGKKCRDRLQEVVSKVHKAWAEKAVAVTETPKSASEAAVTSSDRKRKEASKTKLVAAAKARMQKKTAARTIVVD